MRVPLLLMEDSIYSVNRTGSDVRRSQENEAARILIGIIAVFLTCHALRVTIDCYEMLYIENITACYKIGRDGVHTWVHILSEFSSAMITLNSSVNMIIYGLIKPNIRKHIFRCVNNQNSQEHQTQEEDIFEMNNLLPTQTCSLRTI